MLVSVDMTVFSGLLVIPTQAHEPILHTSQDGHHTVPGQQVASCLHGDGAAEEILASGHAHLHLAWKCAEPSRNSCCGEKHPGHRGVTSPL